KFRNQLAFATLLCGVAWTIIQSAAGDPMLGPPVLGAYTNLAQLSLINCDDPNFQYVLQTSTNLQDWISFNTNSAAPSGSVVYASARNPMSFYRLMVIANVPQPLFNYAILVRSNVNMNGNFVILDSYDSSSPLYSTLGQYDSMK